MPPPILKQIAFIISIFILFSSCNQERKKYKIGFSQCNMKSVWRKTMVSEMKSQLIFYPEMELLPVKDAKDSSKIQIEHIEEFIDEGVDILIVSPNETIPLTNVISKAHRAGIKVVVVDRKTTNEEYTIFVGANNEKIGEQAGNYVIEIAGCNSKILEIWGLKGSSPAQERHKGFHRILKDSCNNKNICVEVKEGDWTAEKIRKILPDTINKYPDIDIVYAHNDEMAIAAHQICEEILGPKNGIKFIGIDGLIGDGEGISGVLDTVLDATFFYPTGGEESIEISASLLGLSETQYEKNTYLPSFKIVAENIDFAKSYFEKKREEERRAGDVLQDMENRNVALSILTVILFLILSGAVYLAFKYYKAVKSERIAKEEMAKSKKQAEESKIAEEIAKEARTIFFTNISHEFKTVLTLILAPLEQMKKTTKGKNYNLKIIEKGTHRLLALINELLMLRQIDKDELKLEVTKIDLIKFTHDIYTIFEPLAKERNINFQFKKECDEDLLNLWIDPNKLDKVIFNLLSNAFKFNKGEIIITIKKDENNAYLFVKDNGKGMTEEQKNNAFKRFHSDKHNGVKGMGIGLALTKGIIDLHHGIIEIFTIPNLGTRFEIVLPLGKKHLSNGEIVETPATKPLYEAQGISLLAENITSLDKEQPFEFNKKNTLLIIEDDPDLLTYLSKCLENDYNLLKSNNKKEGLKLAQTSFPNVIICDIMMDGFEDGIEITKILKQELETSHIPIILMSAKDKDSQVVIGLQSGANNYVTKPLSIDVLKEKIMAALRYQENLRDYYSKELMHPTVPKLNKIDQEFINKFKTLINQNIANQNLTVEDMAQKLFTNKNTLNNKVKAITDKNPAEYFRICKINKAKELILKGEHGLSVIAKLVGYGSNAAFTTAFKNVERMTPTEFKAGNSSKF